MYELPQAKIQCMGILMGIYRFEKESDSQFKAWAVDAPGEYFASTYREWRKGTTSKQEVTGLLCALADASGSNDLRCLSG
jgi:hypothetical protein